MGNARNSLANGYREQTQRLERQQGERRAAGFKGDAGLERIAAAIDRGEYEPTGALRIMVGQYLERKRAYEAQTA